MFRKCFLFKRTRVRGLIFGQAPYTRRLCHRTVLWNGFLFSTYNGDTFHKKRMNNINILAIFSQYLFRTILFLLFNISPSATSLKFIETLANKVGEHKHFRFCTPLLKFPKMRRRSRKYNS